MNWDPRFAPAHEMAMITILGAGTARDPISKTDPLEHVLWGLLKIYSIWSRSDVFFVWHTSGILEPP